MTLFDGEVIIVEENINVSSSRSLFDSFMGKFRSFAYGYNKTFNNLFHSRSIFRKEICHVTQNSLRNMPGKIRKVLFFTIILRNFNLILILTTEIIYFLVRIMRIFCVRFFTKEMKINFKTHKR